MEPVTTHYLEMLHPDMLVGRDEARGVQVSECRTKQYQFNRFLYDFIGGSWGWTDKRTWSDEQWREYVENERTRTWVAMKDGAIAGYYELHRGTDHDVEIIYFGLAGAFIGHGIGGYLLSHAIRSAWQWNGTRRVWVHTCSLDHPNALRNYLDRGMTLYKTEPPGPDKAAACVRDAGGGQH